MAFGVSGVLLPALDIMILVVSSGRSKDLSCRQYELKVYKLRSPLRNLKGQRKIIGIVRILYIQIKSYAMTVIAFF